MRRLVDAFYDAMDREPAAAGIRSMHEPDLSPMRDRLTDWLVGWTGGPALHAQRHPGRPSIMSAHVPFLDPWRALLDTAFDRMCQGLRVR